MAAFQAPCRVDVHGLNARPDLNGRSGRADSFDAASGRYHVTLDGGETVALRAANLRPQNQGRPAGNAAAAAPALAGLDPRFIGIAVSAVLVLLLELSLIPAALLGAPWPIRDNTKQADLCTRPSSRKRSMARNIGSR